jgi:hypothetical protein
VGRGALRGFGWMGAVACAVLPALQAVGQEAPVLRGTQGPEASLALPPAPVRSGSLKLAKPASVTRIGATRPTLRTLEDPGALEAVGALAPVAAPAGLPSPALDPAEDAATRLRRLDEADPYAPLGVRAGAFLLRPTIEVDLGYDDNPGRQPGKVEGAAFTTVAPALDFASDWTRHELRGSIRGELTRYFGAEDPNRPKLDALLSSRIDASRDRAIETELRLSLDTERIGDDGVPETATERPLTTSYGTTLGLVQRFGRTSVSVRGSVDRNAYEEVEGTVDRNYQTYGVAVRGSYEMSPAVQPYVQLGTDWRRHEAEAEEDRNSKGASVTAGAVLDLTGALKGEASIGYGGRRYEGEELEDISGVLANASLVWTPTPLTTVTLAAGTSFDETTEAGASGRIIRTAGVAVAHALRRNLVATASVSYETQTYDGIDREEDTVDAGLGVEYRLSPTTAVRGRYAFEKLTSTVPGEDYTANSMMVGLRLQR